MLTTRSVIAHADVRWKVWLEGLQVPAKSCRVLRMNSEEGNAVVAENEVVLVVPGGNFGPAAEEGGIVPRIVKDCQARLMFADEGIGEIRGPVVVTLCLGHRKGGKPPEVQFVTF